ncbi:MauE/DoxX family redox-associated membrane protein [Chryseobacterium sp. Mn2064]|uniref:MauE/DoxX family redox-associated membrane protein n=1 Tax=Chryseobacterium sp. Mn2064 TaxID=3395263 RepID=UPI003BE2E898
MKNITKLIVNTVAYLFILLLIYASVSKLLDFENFQIQIAQSPLLSTYAGTISYLVIIVELIIVATLIFQKSRLIGLYASLGIMSAFTVYIYLILEYSEFVPCSCGGILENMNWRQHLYFNVVCVLVLIITVILVETKKKIKLLHYTSLIFAIIILSSLSVFLLYLQSEKQLRISNNFTRRYIPHAIENEASLDLNYNSFYFAGQDDGNIYLGNTTAPLNITIVRKDLKGFSKFRIPLDTKAHPFKSLKVMWQSPNYYIYDGTVPIIYRGNLEKTDSLNIVSFDEMYFDQLHATSDNSFLFRSQSSKYKTFIIGDYKNHRMNLHYDLLGTGNTGYIENDGLLISDLENKSFVYVYYYKNEFVSFNNTLGKHNKFRLISFKKEQSMETVKLSDGTTKIKNPLQQSVKNAVISDKILFINSNSKAIHDGILQWNKASIIDIYKTDQQYYSGSFLVPDRHGEKLKDMFIDGKYLYILIGNEIVKYQFAQPILEQLHR